MRTWLVIPAMAVAGGSVAALAGATLVAALAAGGLGAALAAAVRTTSGGSPAATVAAAAAALLGVVGVLDGSNDVARAALAGAAAMYVVAEPRLPLAALAAAGLAAALDASFVGLVPIVALRGPWPGRWRIAVPCAGLVAAGAVVALAPASADPATAAVVIARIGGSLGPLAIVAALAGLAICATRWTVTALAAGAILVELHAGAVAPAATVIAALAVGVGVARLAALVRHPVGQAWLGATAGFVMLVAPVWTLASR